MRPLLLLDVDGVLMPTGNSVPRGFERAACGGAEIVVSQQHGRWLLDLSNSLELVWASTWGEQANKTFGSFFGLPALPIVLLGDLPRDGTRKLGPVAAFAGDRPLAWVDKTRSTTMLGVGRRREQRRLSSSAPRRQLA